MTLKSALVALALALALWAPARADQKLSEMLDAGTITGPELLYCVQGGVQRKCTASQILDYTRGQIAATPTLNLFVTGFSASTGFITRQPQFSDIGGLLQGSQIAPGAMNAALAPPTTSVLGGVLSSARPNNNFVIGVSTSTGALLFARPSCADLSNAVASCSIDATNASNITGGTLANARLPSTLTFSGVLRAGQPALTDASDALVSFASLKTYFPSLVQNVANFGTPGMYWTNCGVAPNDTRSECSWTIRQTISDISAATWPALTIRKDETQTGGNVDGLGNPSDRPAALSIDYRTGPQATGWVRAGAVTMFNYTRKGAGTDARQNVAFAAIANRQYNNTLDPGYSGELTTNWGLWAHAVDFTGYVNPTMPNLGAEIDGFVMPNAGTDNNKTRYGAIIGIGSYTNDPGLQPEIWAGLLVRVVNNGKAINAIHIDECGLCGGTSPGSYVNYITDEDGNLTMRANGTNKFSSPSADTILELQRRGSGNAYLEINKPTGSFESAIYGSRNNALRWKLTLGDNGAEGGGGNQGSNASLQSRNDDGTARAMVWFADRSSGFVGFGGNVSPGYPVDATGQINASAGFRSGGTAGTSGTRTVRASGGAADCTLVITGGIITGGTC